MSRRYLAIVTVVPTIIVAPAAKADYWTPHADITCSRDGNVALIRFGGAEDEEPTRFRTLPRKVDDGLSRARPSKRTDCRLPNGWRLRLRDGERQAFAYGMGGADPPAFFSLWINQRQVFSTKEWKPGYGNDDKPWLTALVVRPDRLTWCRAPYDTSKDGPQRCIDHPFRLDDRYRIDTAEFPPSGRKWKVGTLLATRVAASAGFCRRYVEAMRAPMLDHVAFSFALFGHDKAPFAWDIPFRMRFDSDIQQADIEIAPGIRRRMLLKHGENHFFDGDVVFVLPPGADTAKLAPQIDFRDDDPDALLLGEAPGWTRLIGGGPDIYPGVSPRYVHFIPQRIDGRLYFLASTASDRERPTALLVGIKPEGGARVMCRIQRVEKHF